VTINVAAGSPAQPRDRRAAKATRELLSDELSRVRAGALAWRNGLGALLAGLIGFGLVKGRSDVTQLHPFFAAVVGVLLLAALVAGAVAAVLIMRAAHGRPYAVAVREVVDSSAEDPAVAGRLGEADASQRSLGRGVALSFLCVALLTAAVGLTWYGPTKDKPRIEVRLVNGTLVCGEVVSLTASQLTLKTPQGQVAIDLSQANGIAAVDSCTLPRG
jgi:multisubunit Na+/H+ antiporter MnhG subunit